MRPSLIQIGWHCAESRLLRLHAPQALVTSLTVETAITQYLVQGRVELPALVCPTTLSMKFDAVRTLNQTHNGHKTPIALSGQSLFYLRVGVRTEPFVKLPIYVRAMAGACVQLPKFKPAVQDTVDVTTTVVRFFEERGRGA